MVPGNDPLDGSTNNPGDKKRQKPESSEADPVIREFEQELLAPKPALYDVLLRLEPQHFEKALYLSVSDEGTLRAFMRSIRALCEDPRDDIEPFRNSLCAALAEAIRGGCAEDPMANAWKVQPLLQIAETLVAGLNLNPGHSRHQGLDHILQVSLDLIPMLNTYRNEEDSASNGTSSKGALTEEELSERWLDLHRTSFGLVIDGLKIEGYTPSQAILRVIQKTVTTATTETSNFRYPGYSRSGLEAEAWVHTLRLTATLAKLRYDSILDSHSASLAKICHDIIDWKSEDRLQSASPKELVVIADNLRQCERYALASLFTCKSDQSSQGVWKMITQRNPSHSPGFRLALCALAKHNPSDAKDALGEVLVPLGEPGCSDKISRYHLKTLVRFLSFPGSLEVLKDAFETVASEEASSGLRRRLMGRLQHRFNQHVEAFEIAKTQLRDIESNTGESEEVVRDTLANVGVIWSVRARKGLAKFLVTTP